MAAWIVPALKAVLPHVGSIVAAAAPVFTQKKTDEAAVNQSALVQQQITELQQAAAQNAAHVRELAEQLSETVTALERAAEHAESRLQRATLLSAIAIAMSAVCVAVVLFGGPV